MEHVAGKLPTCVGVKGFGKKVNVVRSRGLMQWNGAQRRAWWEGRGVEAEVWPSVHGSLPTERSGLRAGGSVGNSPPAQGYFPTEFDKERNPYIDTENAFGTNLAVNTAPFPPSSWSTAQKWAPCRGCIQQRVGLENQPCQLIYRLPKPWEFSLSVSFWQLTISPVTWIGLFFRWETPGCIYTEQVKKSPFKLLRWQCILWL